MKAFPVIALTTLLLSSACTTDTEVTQSAVRSNSDTSRHPQHAEMYSNFEFTDPYQMPPSPTPYPYEREVFRSEIKSYYAQSAILEIDGIDVVFDVEQQKHQVSPYVSRKFNTFTQFGLACLPIMLDKKGNQILDMNVPPNCIALLTHNDIKFQVAVGELPLGAIVKVINIQGQMIGFKITDIHDYQALTPESDQTQVVDLETGEELDALYAMLKIFHRRRADEPEVLLMYTCLEWNGKINGARRVISAQPVWVLEPGDY